MTGNSRRTRQSGIIVSWARRKRSSRARIRRACVHIHGRHEFSYFPVSYANSCKLFEYIDGACYRKFKTAKGGKLTACENPLAAFKDKLGSVAVPASIPRQKCFKSSLIYENSSGQECLQREAIGYLGAECPASLASIPRLAPIQPTLPAENIIYIPY